MAHPAAAAVLERLPAGVVVLDAQGRVAYGNPLAQRLLGRTPEVGSVRCCDLLGCRRPGSALEARCLSDAVRARGAALGELMIRVPAGECGSPARHWATTAPWWCTCAPARRRRGPTRASASALGPMRLEVGGTVLDGEWLAHRPGEVLEYLVAMRGRP